MSHIDARFVLVYIDLWQLSLWINFKFDATSRLGKRKISAKEFCSTRSESNFLRDLAFRPTLKVKRLSSNLDEVLRCWRQHRESGERWATVVPSRDGLPVFYGKVEQEEPASCLKVIRWFYQDSQLYIERVHYTVHNSFAAHVYLMMQKFPFKSGSRGIVPFVALLFGLCQPSQATFGRFQCFGIECSTCAFWMRYRRACVVCVCVRVCLCVCVCVKSRDAVTFAKKSCWRGVVHRTVGEKRFRGVIWQGVLWSGRKVLEGSAVLLESVAAECWGDVLQNIRAVLEMTRKKYCTEVVYTHVGEKCWDRRSIVVAEKPWRWL